MENAPHRSPEPDKILVLTLQPQKLRNPDILEAGTN